jgi:hypothetical protein
MPNSEPDSGAMCVTEGQHPSSSSSERDLLLDRAADARTALGRTLCDMKETLTSMVGLRSCAARHPWLLAGSAVAAGVVAGAVLTPRAHKRIQKLRQTPAGSAADSPPACREPEAPRKEKSLVLSIAGTVLVAALQPLLQNLFAPPVAAPGESRDSRPSSTA